MKRDHALSETFLTMADVARMFGVSHEAVRQWVRKGKMPFFSTYRNRPLWTAPVLEEFAAALVALAAVRDAHGTLHRYRSLRCRCAACRHAWAADCARRAIARSTDPDLPHGTASGYENWLCRCEECRAAYFTPQRRETVRRAVARYRARKRLAS